MAKRSPILGYNHNVRYRGLVFHVQTEDSGVLSPHLFTHLFHHGVIVSTRKLVYDSGSAEEAIKSLMQSQHKVVLKELKRGGFDDKIDQYLGGTPGLLPRGTIDEEAEPIEPERASQPVIVRPSQPVIEESAAATFAERTDAEIAMSREPTIEEPAIGLRPTEPAVGQRLAARTQTAERTSGASQVRTNLPAAVEAEAPPRAGGELEDPATAPIASPGASAEIEIQLEIDEDDDLEIDEDDDLDGLGGLGGLGGLDGLGDTIATPRPRRRSSRDTDVAPLDVHTRPTLDIIAPVSDGVPGTLPVAPTLRTPNDVPQPSGPAARLAGRASTAVGASALPPARPISRPPSRPSVSPPQVVSRPLPAEDRRQSSDAIEVYAPAPPSVELPPHANAPERPGQYSQHKKISTRIPMEVVRDGPRPLHPQQGAVPTSGAPPARSSSAVMAAVQPRVASSGSPPPPPAAALRVGATPPQLVIPVASSGPATRPGAPAPAPAPPLRQSSPVIVPAPAGRGTPLPAKAPAASGQPVRPTPVPTPARPASSGSAAAVAVADTVKHRTPTAKESALTPAAGVPAAVASAPASAPISAPVPVAQSTQAASGAATAPTPSRTASVGSPSGGVVLTRPAVIVGAPGKPTPPPQRIRKAREDEGRGFGQGLISEKSLDEVILAYLSEDAEDK